MQFVSALNKLSPSEHEGQFLYCGRWVNKAHFRAYVYGKDIKTIANSYDDYTAYIATGVWFDDPPVNEPINEPIVEEVKDDTTQPKRKRVRK